MSARLADLVPTRRLAGLLLLAGIAGTALTAQSPRYPAAPRDGVVDNYHGTRVADPYRWLERLDTPRTMEWLRAEKSLTEGYLASLPGREAIRRRLTSLWSYEGTSVPQREAGWLFYRRSAGLQPQPVLYRVKVEGSPPQTVLDPNEISPDGSIEIHDYAVSPDATRLAYLRSKGGEVVAETRIRDLSTGRDLADILPGTLTSSCWTRDGRGFFYVRRVALGPRESAAGAHPEKRVLYHLLGRPATRDRLVRSWSRDARWVYCMSSENGRWVLIVAEKGAQNEIRALDLRDPAEPDLAAQTVRLLPDRSALHTPIDIVGNTLYVRTNLSAPKGRVVALDLTQGARALPREVLPESGEVLADAIIAGDRLLVHSLSDAQSRLRLFGLDGRAQGEIPLPEIGSVGWPLSGHPGVPELFYSFSSFLTPESVYRHDLHTGVSVPFQPPRTPFDRSKLETKQVFFISKDGTRVPMFLTAAKDVKLDGSNPVLLTGYGGYGAIEQPSYEPDVPFWVESGGIYAVANLRGGGEYGEEWHRDGMLERKQNSFDDFFAAAEFLIREGYTTPRKLAIYGHSNGGLLVGAALTERPDLFAAAVANAGHYDMLRYPQFTIGAGWISEYGSPDDPAAFRYLRAYSPLHNVRSGVCYPATLLLAADHDDVVVPSHSYKFAAALQTAQGCDRPILLRVGIDASHGYASKPERISERSDLWAFVASRLGVTPFGGGASPGALAKGASSEGASTRTAIFPRR